MRTKKLTKYRRAHLLQKVKFYPFQVDALQVTVWRRYDKELTEFRTMAILKVIYFLDAAETVKYLDKLFIKKKKHEDI